MSRGLCPRTIYMYIYMCVCIYTFICMCVLVRVCIVSFSLSSVITCHYLNFPCTAYDRLNDDRCKKKCMSVAIKINVFISYADDIVTNQKGSSHKGISINTLNFHG